MKHQVFLTDSIETLSNVVDVGCAENYQKTCQLMSRYLEDNEMQSDLHWRFIMGDTMTMVDFGSWSKFFAVIPPVTIKEMNGEE